MTEEEKAKEDEETKELGLAFNALVQSMDP